MVGVWEHNDDTDDTDWETIGVIVTNDIPVDEDFHGIVAAEENAKFNKVNYPNSHLQLEVRSLYVYVIVMRPG